MKLIYKLAMLAMLVGLLPSLSFAQMDTLEVDWTDDGINPTINALRDAIAFDTTETGDRVPNRVYKLLQGGFYWNTDRIDGSGFDLNIVGEPSNPNDPDFGNPPVLIRVFRDNFVDGYIIWGTGSVTLKNLYIIGSDDRGIQTAYQPIELSGVGKKYVFENNIFEKTNFALVAFTGNSNDIIFRDNIFRNLLGRPSTQQWEGRGISIWADQDSVIVENNTFFNIEFTAFQMEGGAIAYLLFNHNTLVNIGRNFTGSWWREAYFTNNLYYNNWYHGETPEDINNPDRDEGAYYTGMLGVGDLPAVYGPEEGRRIAFSNSVAHRVSNFTDWYADSIRAQPLIGSLPRVEHFDIYPQLYAGDTAWVDPGLNTTFSNDQYNKMIQNIEELRNGITPATDFMWNVAMLEGEECYFCPVWPLPEDFSYTADLTSYSSDGLPVGDLNWYPSSADMYYANRDQYVEAISWIPGGKYQYQVVDDMQAEDATLNGDAAVEVFDGFGYFSFDGGGYIQWDFDLDTGGQYDLDVQTNLRGSDIRGQRIIINDVNKDNGGIHDCFGYGEYIWDNVYAGDEPCMSPHIGIFGAGNDQWAWSRIIQDEINEAGALTFNTGANKIRIEPSWGYQDFGQINLLEPGTENIVKELPASAVTDFSIATPKGLVEVGGAAAPFVPSWFKSVQTNTGSVSFDLTAPSAGNFKLQVFYQSPASDVSAVIKEGATTLTMATITGDAEGGGGSALSETFPLTQGAHTIEVDVDNVNIDFVQLVQETIIVQGLSAKDNTPVGFALDQNYPNPFNPTTHIDFSLGSSTKVKLTVFNILGQEVATLVNNKLGVGAYQYEFDGSQYASGVYIYRLEAGDFVSQKKMLLIK